MGPQTETLTLPVDTVSISAVDAAEGDDLDWRDLV